MSVQTYSRDYLQSIPEKMKQQEIDNIVNRFKTQLFSAAATGFTSYRYVMGETAGHHMTSPPPPVLTNEEIVAGFQERFPGCKVFYEEAWVATGPNTQKMKKGIVIDWS